MKKLKKINIATIVAALALSAGCSEAPSSVDSGQLDALKKENESLKAEAANSQAALASLQAEIKTKAADSQAAVAPEEADPPATGEQSTGNPSTKKERFSYAVGLQIGGDFGGKEIDIDFGQFAEGVKTAYLSKDKLMTEDESKKILDEVWKDYQDREKTNRTAEADTAKKAGIDYLAANGKKPGVKVTASGLQYRVIKAGEGTSPTKSDKAEVHYRGWTIDGEEFDSSHSRNETSTFGVTRVIRGWTEALTMMKPGGKWEIVVPQELAYGPGGKRPKIPPYSTLRFEIELISVEQAKPLAKKPVTSNIVRIPSQAELDQGAKPEILTKEQEAELKKENK
jgi:FKBP-type peptidyl-prolyl cis-trans isomerase FklB